MPRGAIEERRMPRALNQLFWLRSITFMPSINPAGFSFRVFQIIKRIPVSYYHRRSTFLPCPYNCCRRVRSVGFPAIPSVFFPTNLRILLGLQLLALPVPQSKPPSVRCSGPLSDLYGSFHSK
ncbi:hypothetical protein KC19_9G149900 [Ceratodon purpureus]|uniref:Uncharacterized protein n=1 Tax=Ceratodon purpureus TaxID=3225 RepID=A0A8T0GVX8_CERPU|nr:hypothetical protein KC19_N006100 [Ceratodon purpureus]KAG0562479.1 hypothetical protein KC19_9G149900 [Ceratodon purpureus]